MYRWILVLLAAVQATGCTNLALHRQTLQQAESLTDLRYQEVMENLAMIAANPATLPSFSSIYAGTADVSDTVSGNSVTTLTRALSKPVGSATNISSESTDVMFSRTVKENWTLDPVVVPEKLRALRAACWWVLCGRESVTGDYDVYLTRYRPKGTPGAPPDGDVPGYYFDVANRLESLGRCWIHVTDRKGVPANAAYQAHCGTVYVWVAPEDVPQLSEFTLVIQGIARTFLPTAYRPVPIVYSIKAPQQKWTIGGITYDAQATVSVDASGKLIAGNMPPKIRIDNLTNSPELRSQILNAKSP